VPPLGLHVYTHARTYKRTGIKQNASAAFMMGIEGPRTPRLTRTMGGHSPLSFSLATYFRVDHGSLTLFWTRSDPTRCVGDPTRSDPSCTRNCQPDPTRPDPRMDPTRGQLWLTYLLAYTASGVAPRQRALLGSCWIKAGVIKSVIFHSSDSSPPSYLCSFDTAGRATWRAAFRL